MIQIEVSEPWHEKFPGARVGVVLLANVDNSKCAKPLEQWKQKVESSLREKYSGSSRADLLELEVLKTYRDYYRQFNNTYHVQLQMES